MDLTRTITNNHKRLNEVNQSTSNQQIDINQISDICSKTDNLNQSNLDQFEDAVCNVLNGINNTYDSKNFKGRPKIALFCSYCSSHGHAKGRCFKRPQREQQRKPRERSFYVHMRNNQNLTNRQISSNNVSGRQLPSTSPVYSNHRSRTPNRNSRYPSNQTNRTYNNNSRYSIRPYSNNRSYSNHQSYLNNRPENRYDHNNRNRSQSYNRNNNNRNYSNNRNRSNSYHRNNRNNNISNSNRSISNNLNNQRYNSRSLYQHSRSQYQSRSPYNRDRNSNSNNGSRYHSNDRNRGSNNQNYRKSSNNGNRNNHKPYHRQNGNRINNIEDKPNENEQDPPGIEECNYSTDSSDEDQQILEKFYSAQENTCNSINTIESNPTWILPMYQCTSFETDFTKQKPILEIDFLLDSGATLNLLNEDTWNELKYNNPHLQLTKSIRTLTAAKNIKIETLGTINLNVTPERISNSRSNPHPIFNIFFYVTKCNNNILGTPFFKEYTEKINVNTNTLTINTPTDIDNEIHFFQNTTKEYQ